VPSHRQTPIPVTHSGIQLFEPTRVLTTFERGFTEEIFSKTILIGPTLEFEISGARNVYVDLQNIHLQIQVTLLSLDHANGNAALRTLKPIADVAADKAVIVNNALHSIFSNVEVSLQGEIIGTSNNHYLATRLWSRPNYPTQPSAKTHGSHARDMITK
jgi:hypothetical protein